MLGFKINVVLIDTNFVLHRAVMENCCSEILTAESMESILLGFITCDQL